MPIPVRLLEEEFVLDCPIELRETAKGVIRNLLPAARVRDDGIGRQLLLFSKSNVDGIFTSVNLQDSPFYFTHVDKEIASADYNLVDQHRRVKERARQGLFSVLSKEYNIPESPWGTLTGVRPTKLYHRLFDRGFPLDRIRTHLRDVYSISRDKIALLVDVASRQRPFFAEDVNSPIGIYIGIPFCPTRCSYCSFAAFPVSTHGHLVEGFVQALCQEIEEVGKLLRDMGKAVESVYIGGGTPTTLNPKQLNEVLELTKDSFVSQDTREFTVEAGRPETITGENARIMANWGVNRVSINPQTMHEATLKRIGRRHTTLDVKKAYTIVREVGIPIINMDLILGLPGETVTDVEKTLKEVSTFNPENLTVHSLAMKRAANMRKDIGSLQLAQEQGDEMVDVVWDWVGKLALKPYYLYRQRFILSDLENIGFAKAGTESIYNIQMMEERQSIIALGGGGITKLVNPDLSLRRLANPKCPATYTQQLSADLPAKLYQIRQHFAV